MGALLEVIGGVSLNDGGFSDSLISKEDNS